MTYLTPPEAVAFTVAIEFTRAGTTCNPVTNPEPPTGFYDFKGLLPNGAFQFSDGLGLLMTIQRNVGAGRWDFVFQRPDWYTFTVGMTWDAGAGVFTVDHTTTPGVGDCTLRVQVAWTPEIWCADAALRNRIDELCPPDMDLLRWDFEHRPLWGCRQWRTTETTDVDSAGHVRGNMKKFDSQAAPRRPGQSIRYRWTGP